VLKLAPQGSPEAEDIEREAALLATIPSGEARAAQLAPLLDRGGDERWCWLLLEDLGGTDLARHWVREGVSWQDVVDVGQAIAGALACLHDHGVLHRDVKEANIVVTPGKGPGRYHLVDLGIGRRLDHRVAVTMDLRGSHDRVPPEAVTAARKVGPPGDVFVLCKLLAQGLVGSPNTPWPDDVDAQLAACGLDAADPRHLALVRLLARGMRLDPGQRPRSAELVQGFADIRAGRVGQARPRWWLPLVSFAAGGALVATAVAVALRPEPQAPPSIAFEDASATWGVAVAAPDARPKEQGAAPSSGFFGDPYVADLDGDGSWELVATRQGRVWETTHPDHLRELALRWSDGGFVWSVLDGDDGPRQVWSWMHAELDGDGLMDRVGLDQDDSWMYRTVLERSGAAYQPEILTTPFPFLIPTLHGARQLDTPGWLPGQQGAEAARWSTAAIGTQPTGWMDLDRDGDVELLADEDDRPLLLRWQDQTWQPERLVELEAWTHGVPPGATMVPADLDGDGDEDLLVGAKEGAQLVFFANQDGELVRVRGAELSVLDPGELVRQTYSATVAVDLDADGLRDIVLSSGGFPDKGHAGSKVFRNLGDWRFERVPLPASLAEAHDGSAAVVLDVDGDGRLDVLHLSINDREREVPTHRAWRGTGASEHRSWALHVERPGGGPLPLGTRLEATAPRPWLTVIRDVGHVYLPSWLTGQLLVILPDGRIGSVELGEGLAGPTTAPLVLDEGPPLYAPGAQRLQPGVRVEIGGEPSFHALQPDWELLLDREPRPGSMQRWSAGAHDLKAIPLYDEGLGCDGARCLIQLRAPGGGYTPALLWPRTGQLEPLEAEGDMSVAHTVAHGRAWTASGNSVWERDPESYALMGTSPTPEPKRYCDALAYDGAELACASREPPHLVVYDPDSMEARLDLPLPDEGGGSLLATPGGWVVSLRSGLAWVSRDGALDRSWLVGEPLLGVHDGLAWGILHDRVLWIDLEAERVQGGMVVPGAHSALPVPMGGQLGHH